jgi:hypothetical protein
MAANPESTSCIYIRKIFDPKAPENVSYGLSPNDARNNFLVEYPAYEERESIKNLVIQLFTWEDGQSAHGMNCQDGKTTTDFNMLWELKSCWLRKLYGKNNELAIAIENAYGAFQWAEMGRLAENGMLVVDPIPAERK